jgi:hypothetical protein
MMSDTMLLNNEPFLAILADSYNLMLQSDGSDM